MSAQVPREIFLLLVLCIFSKHSSSQVNTASIKFKLTDRPANPLLPDDHGTNSMSLSLSDMRWHIPLSELSSIVDFILNGDDKADKHMLKNCEHRIRNILPKEYYFLACILNVLG